jgi:hypothetical protein
MKHLKRIVALAAERKGKRGREEQKERSAQKVKQTQSVSVNAFLPLILGRRFANVCSKRAEYMTE